MVFPKHLYFSGLLTQSTSQFMTVSGIVNFISLPQEERGIFVNKAAVEMQNNLPFCD
jgi:hypothetical protein